MPLRRSIRVGKKEGRRSTGDRAKHRVRDDSSRVRGGVQTDSGGAGAVQIREVGVDLLQKARNWSRLLSHVSRLPELEQTTLFFAAYPGGPACTELRDLAQQAKADQARLDILFHVFSPSGLWPLSTSSNWRDDSLRIARQVQYHLVGL
jgi:hypothetical protein